MSQKKSAKDKYTGYLKKLVGDDFIAKTNR
jgi:hypothetical protein